MKFNAVKIPFSYSNTTLVKVKFGITVLRVARLEAIQIQHLLKLNLRYQQGSIFHLSHSNTTLVKVKS